MWWRNTEGLLALEPFGSVGVMLNVVIGVIGNLKKKKDGGGAALV